MSIALGEKVLREPYWHHLPGFPMYLKVPRVGRIVYINYAHRWYMVEYNNGLRESFIMRDARRDPKTIGGINAHTGGVREAVAPGESEGAGSSVQGAAPGARESSAEARLSEAQGGAPIGAK